MLPAAAYYDTDGRPGWEETYRLEYRGINRKPAGQRAMAATANGGS
jgi:hypothetical protein